MASKYMPLRQIFDLTVFTVDQRIRVFDLLKLGRIGAVSGVSRKVNLRYWYTEDDLGAAISRLPIPESSLRFAFEQARGQSDTYRIWEFGEYYTIQSNEHGFQVFAYGGREDVIRDQDINPDFWQAAWIDETRWVVLCDELMNLRRHEFSLVGLLRDDVQKQFGLGSTPRERRGAKQQYFVEKEAYEAAQRILRQQPNISRTRWEGDVLEAMVGPKPGRTVFGELYGHLYTEHRKRRNSGN